MYFSPFVKQLFVASAPLLASLSVGGAVSFPTVLLHQLKRKDTAIPLDFATASWIGAIHGLGGIPSILMQTIMQWKGRKFTSILAYCVTILGWILAYSANNTSMVLASEAIQGFGCNSIYSIAFISIGEMMAPAYRDPFIQLYMILEMSVMATNGLLTHYLHWKTISMVMSVPLVIAIIITCMCPESPYWFACKGEFEKCEKAFKWLRGTDRDAANELKEMIDAQKENIACDKLQHDKAFNHFIHQITSKEFYIPAMHIFILQYLVYGIGNVVVVIYSLELFQKATDSNNIAFYGSFIVNFIQLLGISITIILSKYFNKKTILLTSTAAATLSLLCVSAASYLKALGFFSSGSLIILYFVIAYLVSISLGITSVAYCIASVIMPVRYRNLGGVFYVANTCMLHTVVLKVAPYLLLLINLHGTFLVFAFNGLLSGIIIWRFVPETRGKTLQQIENYYVHGRFDVGNLYENDNDHMVPMI